MIAADQIITVNAHVRFVWALNCHNISQDKKFINQLSKAQKTGKTTAILW